MMNNNKNDDRYKCRILIDYNYRVKGYSKSGLKLLCDKAKENGIKELYNNLEIDREKTLKVFESVGFEIVKNLKCKKFNKDVDGVEVRIKL